MSARRILLTTDIIGYVKDDSHSLNLFAWSTQNGNGKKLKGKKYKNTPPGTEKSVQCPSHLNIRKTIKRFKISALY